MAISKNLVKSLIILVIMFNVSLLKSQDTGIQDNAKPIIELPAHEFDFGTLRRGDTAIHTIHFRNTGTEPLLVKRVKTTCGCTIVNWSKKPVDPGKSDDIEVKVKTYRMGYFYSRIKIISNSANSPSFFEVKGKITLD